MRANISADRRWIYYRAGDEVRAGARFSSDEAARVVGATLLNRESTARKAGSCDDCPRHLTALVNLFASEDVLTGRDGRTRPDLLERLLGRSDEVLDRPTNSRFRVVSHRSDTTESA